MEKGGTSHGNHYHRYIEYAAVIINSYRGNESFHLFLKKYFASHKKHGSRDRKLIASLCYNYFRLGFGVSPEIDVQERIQLAAFLCGTGTSILPGHLEPGWDSSVQLSINDKLKAVERQFEPQKIFPFCDELSSEINDRQFNLSFLIQPKLFIRIRTGFKDIVLNKIHSAGLKFEQCNDNCLAFANNEKISSIIDLDKEAVVQDYNSQKTLDLLVQAMTATREAAMSVWDCCAGSGGKSILCFDKFNNISLTVSDKRRTILENLELRFDKAGIAKYTIVEADLQPPVSPALNLTGPFDVIIADVPCTGSGTWSRTPEQVSRFRKKEIDSYAALQRSIVENSVTRLAEGGYYLYITCSVFKKENEENVHLIQKKFELTLIKMEYLKGYEMQADTLFVALLRK
jgi:16S rRNA (cytosine967-C5)-methyltransferase